jgi:hypothetical protein
MIGQKNLVFSLPTFCNENSLLKGCSWLQKAPTGHFCCAIQTFLRTEHISYGNWPLDSGTYITQVFPAAVGL